MAVPIVMPKLGMVMVEGTLTKWTKSPGGTVQQGEVVAEIETEKISYELEATDSGTLHPIVEEGATVPVGDALGYLLAEGEAPPEAPPPTEAPSQDAPAQRAPTQRRPSAGRGAGDVVPSTPGARRLAAKLEVEISSVTPTGPRGRVVEADVRAYADGQTAAASPVPPGLPEPSKTVPVEGMRKAIAEHMRGSISSTAQLTFLLDVDVTEAERLRKEVSKKRGTTLTKAHMFIKACVETLKDNPILNTVLADGKVLHFDDVNMAIAVALDEGLVVPVLREAQDKTIFQISEETRELTTKVREGKIAPDDLVGGTFTISVLGTVDGFTPILNPGQSGILGVGRTVEKPVVRDGEIVVRTMTTVSLTVDHQVVDGVVAAAFLKRLQQVIGQPAPLFE